MPDCHGGDCEEDDVDNNNVEIHPVYAVDVFQPSIDREELTGAWAADDAGTYYLRQLGDHLWWLGMSRDRGRTFANVFSGQLTRTDAGLSLSGEWADVPLGFIQNDGALNLVGPNFFNLRFASGTGNFGARGWEKIREAGIPVAPVG